MALSGSIVSDIHKNNKEAWQAIFASIFELHSIDVDDFSLELIDQELIITSANPFARQALEELGSPERTRRAFGTELKELYGADYKQGKTVTTPTIDITHLKPQPPEIKKERQDPPGEFTKYVFRLDHKKTLNYLLNTFQEGFMLLGHGVSLRPILLPQGERKFIIAATTRYFSAYKGLLAMPDVQLDPSKPFMVDDKTYIAKHLPRLGDPIYLVMPNTYRPSSSSGAPAPAPNPAGEGAVEAVRRKLSSCSLQ